MSHYMDAIIAALKLSHRAFTEGRKKLFLKRYPQFKFTEV